MRFRKPTIIEAVMAASVAASVVVAGLLYILRTTPYRGLRFDRGARPLTSADAMRGAEAFVREHGWNMHTGTVMIAALAQQTRPRHGIPWWGLTRVQFPAITQDGILYVPMRGFGPECDGLAFNPRTNRFPSTFNGFKPVGGGWCEWKQTMAPAGEQKY